MMLAMAEHCPPHHQHPTDIASFLGPPQNPADFRLAASNKTVVLRIGRMPQVMDPAVAAISNPGWTKSQSGCTLHQSRARLWVTCCDPHATWRSLFGSDSSMMERLDVLGCPGTVMGGLNASVQVMSIDGRQCFESPTRQGSASSWPQRADMPGTWRRFVKKTGVKRGGTMGCSASLRRCSRKAPVGLGWTMVVSTMASQTHWRGIGTSSL